MRIDPTGAGKASGADVKRTTGTVRKDGLPEVGSRSSAGPEPRRDEVTISDTARELLGASEGASAPRALDTGRAREILGRIASGYYDRPDVRNQVLDRLAQGLGLSPSD